MTETLPFSEILEFPQEKCVEARLLVDARDYYLAFCSAALQAENTLLIAGWQFDTEVELVRGADQSGFEAPARFIHFLNHLCEQKESLHVYILAWDYSSVYALEREWLQGLKFRLKVHERVHFCYWTHPEPGGSFHQKYVVVDGHTAFLGGLDICDARYDDRMHRLDNALRVDVEGKPCKPFHDLQLAMAGPVARRLAEMFFELWTSCSEIDLKPFWRRATDIAHEGFAFEQGLALSCSSVALSRTVFRSEHGPVCEVRELLCRAIDGAEKLIYLENQYFTSKDILFAFKARLEDPERSRLSIVMVMPEGADSAKEDFVLGSRQRAVRHAVAQMALRHGHEMRLLKSTQHGPNGPVSTFIHSKLMIVDDTLLICGSANLTNRSMHVDLELNVSICAEATTEEGAKLRDDIRRVRASLLAEHAGVADSEQFAASHSFLELIDAACASESSKLDCQTIEAPEDSDPLLVALFDPHGSTSLESLEVPFKEAMSGDDNLLKNAMRRIGQRLGVFDIDDA